ncbi:MAG: hydrogenase expression/formation protein HypE [Nitrososphaeria archaeon]
MEERVSMLHGAGGAVTQALIRELIVSRFHNDRFEVPLEALDDASVINDIVFKTDSHAVYPLFFPGGDIGRLSVCGTVNDILMIGGSPLALSLGLIMEEGLEISILKRVLDSMKHACDEAKVKVVTGDTKVVEKGGLKQMVTNTSGIGYRNHFLDQNLEVVKSYRSLKSRWLLDSNLLPGDKIIVSGFIGDHGIAVMSARQQYGLSSNIRSDMQPLNHLVNSALREGGVVAMKDPTRGGLSNTLYEWCEKSMVGIEVDESKIPIREGVKSACEILGINPLEIGNEGKAVLAVIPQKAESVLDTLRKTKEGANAEIIGEVLSRSDKVVMKTAIGGRRILQKPRGDPIPRIC